jgi:hypothetical protein
MAQCIAIDAGTGAVTASVADPCIGFVVLTPAEYGALSQTPWTVIADPADAAVLGAAMVAVWCAAWGLRALRKSLDTDGEKEND